MVGINYNTPIKIGNYKFIQIQYDANVKGLGNYEIHS